MRQPHDLPIRIFCSYTHRDEKARERLGIHLSILVRQGLVRFWHDREIRAGEDWEGIIHEHLNSADIIILMISADFIASPYCWDREMKRALERHDEEEATVVPILIAPAYWTGAQFGRLQMLPPNGKPVALWRDKEEAWSRITGELREVAERIHSGQQVWFQKSGPANVANLAGKPLSYAMGA